ncbi:MAG: enoyl-CoA hydratase/isomerase family protein [Acidobacteriaceae bacterium]
MTYENLRCEVRGPVATVTLDRPKVLNALNVATIGELHAVFTALAADEAVRAILLTGAGEKAFAAGADINELAMLNGMAGKELALRGQAVFSLIENCGKPVIACINGFALGGGCELALACTLRLASETARLGQPEVKLGLIPGYGGSQRLPRLVGKGAALQLILTGDMISAQEALRIGLVNEVLPAEKLLARGEEIAQSIASVAPLAVKHCLEAVNHGYDLPLDEALYLEASLFGLCCGTEDKAEGTEAFLTKRKPEWNGR